MEVLRDAHKVAFGIVTIGDKLENETDRLFKKGEGARAMVLDGIGSTAADTTADLLNEVIDNQAKKLGYETTKRFSPGYGKWGLENQDIIFDSFEGAERRIGVYLKSSKMMVPLKSVSFAVKLGKKTMTDNHQEKCSSCIVREKCLDSNNENYCLKLPVR